MVYEFEQILIKGIFDIESQLFLYVSYETPQRTEGLLFHFCQNELRSICVVQWMLSFLKSDHIFVAQSIN